MSELSNKISKTWDDICLAVANKHDAPHLYERIYIGSIQKQTNNLNSDCKIDKPISTVSYKYLKLSPPLSHVKLTPREAQVLYLVCQGLTNCEVGDRIGLSPRTVEYYIKNMRKKTLAISKKQLIRQILTTNFMHCDEVKLFYENAEIPV